ncbi:hypothetical protein GCM10009530_16580 [Microbispora corallina]|uniref:HTH luxR-type domain-containing protein n=1 Tax=Microbispora corallina TaxID=83302 RepID=A0ABQ4FXS7_9ACTN|nr:LuxR C-terminal-related transcriptional regulator [Microbispora corallina]GIH39617.1 hypothetical protein Mco01_26170 [Microbispora corallina]
MPQPSARDYDRMLELASALLQSPEPKAAWTLIGRQLLGPLVRGDVFTRVDVDYTRSAGRMLDIEPEPAARQTPPGSDVHRTIIAEHPLAVHYGRTGTLAPLRVSDLMPSRAWRRTVACATMREVFGTTHALGVPLRSRPFRGLSVQLAGGDFSERDLAVVRRLQPLLVALDRHERHLARWRDVSGGPDTADAVAGLRITPRELVVLTAMADGLTAAGIARRLNIAVRTVGKHQENLYRKLRASDRLGAVLTAQRLGILPVPRSGEGGDAGPRG